MHQSMLVKDQHQLSGDLPAVLWLLLCTAWCAGGNSAPGLVRAWTNVVAAHCGRLTPQTDAPAQYLPTALAGRAGSWPTTQSNYRYHYTGSQFSSQ